MQFTKLSDLADVSISNVNKKTSTKEKAVHLCNYVDVYYNWAITKDNMINSMASSASDKQIVNYSLHKGDVVITKDSETRDDIGVSAYVAA